MDNNIETLTINYDAFRKDNNIYFGMSINDNFVSSRMLEIEKLKDKAILSQLTIKELQDLIKLYQEIIEEKELEGH